MKRKVLGPLLISALLLSWGIAAAAADQPSTPDPKVKVGDTAPDFTMRDQNGKEVKLSDFRGKKNVVLAFYVFAFTGG
jgi:cytochrome oxidase Cu insertion factor (SCO1/SenC/PrrC family)